VTSATATWLQISVEIERLKASVSESRKEAKYNVGVEVIKTNDRGYGVRSNRTFDPNQIIVEYTGEIITQEECETQNEDHV